ncbi:MAG: GNAT family N-acetyltransferase [Acidobacteria bacterium]|nr:GNAT family N-acetyltransferase [Acidobacteriota bacterium]
MARSAETGEMVGALLTEESASAPPGGMDQLSAKFDPIFDILGQLDAEYRTGRPIRPGESLHLFLLGVAPRFTGRGIAHRLVSTAVSHGVARKYRVAVKEATNKTSQHVFRTHGFVERVQRSYQNHQFSGRAVFGSIADQGGPILMDKQLVP